MTTRSRIVVRFLESTQILL